jgi:hypothetical protein
MSNVNGNGAAAGWYPDPAGSPQQRWWDGTQWTGYLQGPTTPVAPAGYSNAAPIDPRYATAEALVQRDLGAHPAIYTPFIWIIALLPLLSTIAFALFDLNAYATIGRSSEMSSMGMLTNPLYLVNAVLGWVIYGVSVWLAYLDWRALSRIGVVRPFHWAWTFLGGVVYVVGRSVVVRRRVGTGLVPVWVAIGVFVIGMVVGIAKIASFLNAVMSTVDFS